VNHLLANNPFLPGIVIFSKLAGDALAIENVSPLFSGIGEILGNILHFADGGIFGVISLKVKNLVGGDPTLY
jgi:hypothetical protein